MGGKANKVIKPGSIEVRGVTRQLVSAGFWNAFLWKNGIWSCVRELERFRDASPAQRRQDLGRRLLAQILYFGRREDALPEWREAAAGALDAETLWRIWPSLPITTKRDLVSRFPPEDTAARFGLRGRINSSGGSTGEPTHFFQDTEMIRIGIATTVFSRVQMGWRPGMPVIALWGSDRDLGKPALPFRERCMARLRNDWIIAGYRVDESTVDRFLGALQRNHPAAVYGYSSMLEHVARRVLERDEPVGPGWVHTAWGGAEMLFESQSELFRKAFGVPLLNWYGSREFSVIAYQRRPAEALEVVRPYVFLEVVDEQGRPCRPGEPGRVLVTSTVCRGTPFLRYEIGDIGTFDAAHQDESGVRALRTLEGRTAGLLKLPNGTTVNSLFWNQIFKEFGEIVQFQVVLRQEQEIEVRLTGRGITADRELELRRVLDRFTSGVPVTITWMEQIPLTRQGKLLQVVRE